MFNARLAAAALAATLLPDLAFAGVDPMLQTSWGQGAPWNSDTPVDAQGEATYPGCTTLAAAQVLYYYGHQSQASQDVGYVLDHEVTGPDVVDSWIEVPLSEVSHDWSAMALSDAESELRVRETGRFLYNVALTLNAQFGDPSGSPSTGKQLENAFRYQWGYNQKSRRSMSVISKSAFGFSDAEWAQLIYDELDAGRPVIHMALQLNGDAGHAFVIDGYRDDGLVHVNWGWGGYANGWYDANTLVDPSGRSWSRDAMIFRGLEPEDGYAAAMAPASTSTPPRWTGNGSLISLSSGGQTGYGTTQDEASIYAGEPGDAVVFFQWEVDSQDGERLELRADGVDTATITYGVWGDRSEDKVYREVSLPFVLDPSQDGYADLNGQYFVVAVELEGDGVVEAQATAKPASSASSAPARRLQVGEHAWSGVASVISHSTGSLSGYGLTQDEAVIMPGERAPAVYVQWEVSAADGQTLVLDAPSGMQAEVSYGSWSGHRGDDVVRSGGFPMTLDPAADGLSVADGEFYVIQVAFTEAPAEAGVLSVEAR